MKTWCMKNVGRKKLRKQKNPAKNSKNPDPVHHRFLSAGTEIRIRDRDYGSPCSNQLNFRGIMIPRYVIVLFRDVLSG